MELEEVVVLKKVVELEEVVVLKKVMECSAFCCQEPDVDKTGTVDWILCDICNNWYHWDCIGIEKNPSGALVS